MPTFEYQCRPEEGGCGHHFDRFCIPSRSDEPATCPECATRLQETNPKGRLLARVFIAVRQSQVFVPAHFRTTLATTGFGDGQGRSGGYEDLKDRFNRWDSGCKGPMGDKAHAKLKARAEGRI